MFANEPIFQVEGPLAQCQLVETALLNIINYQTLIATKAARIRSVIGDAPLLEFGTRRAQEMDAAIWGTRAAVIGGADATSNVRAGKIFGIPVSGTHAHALVQAYGNDYDAFKAYASTHKDCVFLVDTYDTLKIGVPNAIRVAKELGDKINFLGVRLDSGDLAYLSKQVRKQLDAAGFPNAKIYASNDLDENTILNLKMQKAKIDVWGVGTKLITAYDQPALGASGSVSYMFDKKGVIVFAGEDADAIFEQLLEADVDVEDVEAEDGTITVYTEPTDLHKALEALRANGQEEFQVTELEMIPQSEVTLEGEDLEVFEGLVDALEADDDVQKVYHNVAI